MSSSGLRKTGRASAWWGGIDYRPQAGDLKSPLKRIIRDVGLVPFIDIVGQSMRVGIYQDQMTCALNSKRSGDFPHNRNQRTGFVAV